MRSSALVTSHRCCFDFVIKLSKSLCNIIFDGLKQRFAEIVEHSSPCDLAHRAQSSCPSIDCTRRSEKNLYTALKFFYVQAWYSKPNLSKKISSTLSYSTSFVPIVIENFFFYVWFVILYHVFYVSLLWMSAYSLLWKKPIKYFFDFFNFIWTKNPENWKM